MKAKQIICCLVAICLLALTACSTVPDTSPGNSTPIASTTERYAAQVVELANAEREKAGVPAVPVDPQLMKLAAIRAEELATSFSHTRPNGEGDQYTGLPDYEWVMCNLGMGYLSPAEVVNGWMHSPGHRRNMLYAGHDSVGAGCYQDSSGTLYWCIIFYRDGGFYPGY